MTKNMHISKLGYRPCEAAFALGSEKLLQECVQAGWLKPIIKRHRLTLYALSDITRCWARILGGEVPQ
jgi:hypothetical protein